MQKAERLALATVRGVLEPDGFQVGLMASARHPHILVSAPDGWSRSFTLACSARADDQCQVNYARQRPTRSCASFGPPAPVPTRGPPRIPAQAISARRASAWSASLLAPSVEAAGRPAAARSPVGPPPSSPAGDPPHPGPVILDTPEDEPATARRAGPRSGEGASDGRVTFQQTLSRLDFETVLSSVIEEPAENWSDEEPRVPRLSVLDHKI